VGQLQQIKFLFDHPLFDGGWRLLMLACLVLVFPGLAPQQSFAENTSRKDSSPFFDSVAITPEVRGHLEIVHQYRELNWITRANNILRHVRLEHEPEGNDLVYTLLAQALVHHHMEEYDDEVGVLLLAQQEKNVHPLLLRKVFYQLAQAEFVRGDYQQAVSLMSEIAETDEDSSAALLAFTAKAQYLAGQLVDAMKSMKAAVVRQEQDGLVVPEDWLLLQRQIFIDSGDRQRVAFTTEQLLWHYPESKRYWIELAASYEELGYQALQRDVLYLAYLQQMLETEEEYQVLASRLIFDGLPLRAALVLENGFDRKIIDRREANKRLMSNAWFDVQKVEQRIQVLNKEIGNASPASKPEAAYAELALIYLDRKNFPQATRMAWHALKSYGEQQPVSVKLIMGEAMLNQFQFNQAIGLLDQIIQDSVVDEESKRLARHWQTYARNLQDHYQSLQ
jgi:tetratricopeptide (TPR) repeat protein